MFKTSNVKFLKLKDTDRSSVVVRVEKIISMHKEKEGTRIILEEETSYLVGETVDEIFNKL